MKTEDGYLKVKIHEHGDTAKILGDVTVSIEGPTRATMKSRTINGIADFGAVPPGSYTISLTLPEALTRTHAPPDAKASTSVSAKQQQLALVPVPLLDLVTPKLEVEYPVVLFDRGLDAHQPPGETPLKPDPTYVLLSASQAIGTTRFKTSGRLSATNVAVFRDPACSQAFDLGQPIPAEQLLGGAPLKLWLRGTTPGRFTLKLTLDDPADGRLALAPPATVEMGVVELQLIVHRHDAGALAKLQVDPDTDPVKDYHEALEKLALPAQQALDDKAKIADGRLLHVQDGGRFGRAKLVLKARTAGHWPAAADPGCQVVLAARGSGGLKLFDAENEGTEQALPLKIAASALTADRSYWLEGSGESETLRGSELSVGLDRAAGGLAKSAKAGADVVRSTVIRISSIALQHQAETGKPDPWDDKEKRWFINFRPDPEGRKLTIKATLSRKLAGLKLHFMLAADRNNGRVANWGVDMPHEVATEHPVSKLAGQLSWTWKQIPVALKAQDRQARKDFLHLSALTDGDGAATRELQLSRCAGDRFLPMAYSAEDPHLAKYIDGHAKLGVRKPVACGHAIDVWRKFWCQRIVVDGVTSPDLAPAIAQYARVRVLMELVADIRIPLKDAKAMKPPSIYPRYMVEVNGGNSDALLVSDTNKAQFFAKAVSSDAALRPLKVTTVICDAQWDGLKGGATASAADIENVEAAYFDSHPIAMSADILSPPLQGGPLVAGGEWVADEWDEVKKDWVNERRRAVVDADIVIATDRKAVTEIKARPPGALKLKPNSRLWLLDLRLKGANDYLGECSGRPPRLLAVYDPKNVDDFFNTVVHECGHAFWQAPKAGVPGGVPDHPETRDKGQGNHCRHEVNKCVMFDSGPIAGSHNRYCDVCHAYVLLTDFAQFAPE